MGYRAKNGKYYARKETRAEYHERKAREANGDIIYEFFGNILGVFVFILILGCIFG